MSNFETHIKKYGLFKKDAKNKTISHMTRIDSYFNAAFQLIEAYSAKYDLHINKHQLVRTKLLEFNIFKEDIEIIWRQFQLLENQIRPGQQYGGKINGEQLKRAKKAFDQIEKASENILK